MREILSRDFVLTFICHFLFGLCFSSLLPTLPLYLSSVRFDDTQIGVLIGAFGIASLLLRPASGIALQRYAHKHIIAFGCVCFTITAPALLFLNSFWPLFLIRIIQGTSFALVTTASFALVVEITPPERRSQSIAYFLLSANISMMIAPSFGMFLIHKFSFSFLFITLLFISLGSALMTIPLSMIRSGDGKAAAFELGSLISRPAVPASLISMGQQFGWGAISTFFSLYAVQKGVSNPGLFFGSMAAAMIACRVFGSDLMNKHGPRQLIAILISGTTFGFALLAFSGTQVMFVLIGIILGSANAFMMPTTMDYAVRRAGPSSGAAVATFMGLSDFGMAIGPVIMGVVASTFGYSSMFICVAITSFLNLIYSAWILQDNGRNSLDGSS